MYIVCQTLLWESYSCKETLFVGLVFSPKVHIFQLNWCAIFHQTPHRVTSLTVCQGRSLRRILTCNMFIVSCVNNTSYQHSRSRHRSLSTLSLMLEPMKYMAYQQGRILHCRKSVLHICQQSAFPHGCCNTGKQSIHPVTLTSSVNTRHITYTTHS